MKRGRGMCGTFKVNNLTYHTRTMFIDINRLNRPCSGMFTYLWTDLGMCTYHRVIYMLTLHTRTNVPLSSARLPTSYSHTQYIKRLILNGKIGLQILSANYWAAKYFCKIRWPKFERQKLFLQNFTTKANPVKNFTLLDKFTNPS